MRVVEATNRGQRVWALVAEQPRSEWRYTLSDGTICWDWTGDEKRAAAWRRGER